MSTNDFFFILLWSLFGEAIVLGVCVPIVIWTVNRTRPMRAQRASERNEDQYTKDAAALFRDLYADITGGAIAAPKQTEDRVLDMCARASDLKGLR